MFNTLGEVVKFADGDYGVITNLLEDDSIEICWHNYKTKGLFKAPFYIGKSKSNFVKPVTDIFT